MKRLLEDFRGQPWLGWLMVCLARQSVRQAWLREVARTRLRDVEDHEGAVPGLPGWTFEFHGGDVCLTGPDGEVLDGSVDGEAMDPYFFADRVLSLDPPPHPEAQLLRYLPDRKLIVAALAPLRAAGYLQGQHTFVLRADWQEAAPDVAGDYDFGSGDFSGFLLGLVEADRRCLGPALPLLDETRRTALCLEILRGPVDSSTGEAVLALQDLPDGEAEVLAFARRLDPAKHHPYPACCVARYLLGRGRRREGLQLVERFAAVRKVEGYQGNPMDDEFAFVLLDGAPDRALPYVRRALRSSTPAAVSNMAALLSLLDKPWTRRELLAALQSRELGVTERRYVAAALSRSGDLDARRRALQLSPELPERDPEAVGWSFDEVIANSLPGLLGHLLERYRPLARRLEHVVLDA